MESRSKPASSVSSAAPQKPFDAIRVFIEEKKEKFTKKNSDLNASEINRRLTAKYNQLSEQKKNKYKKKALARKAEHQRVSSFETIDTHTYLSLVVYIDLFICRSHNGRSSCLCVQTGSTYFVVFKWFNVLVNLGTGIERQRWQRMFSRREEREQAESAEAFAEEETADERLFVLHSRMHARRRNDERSREHEKDEPHFAKVEGALR